MEYFEKNIQESKETIEFYEFLIKKQIEGTERCGDSEMKVLQFLFNQRQREIDDIEWRTEHMKGE